MKKEGEEGGGLGERKTKGERRKRGRDIEGGKKEGNRGAGEEKEKEE